MAENFNLERSADAKLVFKMLDVDKDGVISKNDLMLSMQALDLSPSDKQLENIIKSVDTNKNNNIELDEFVIFMNRERLRDAKSEDLRETFQLFDKDGDGFITVAELQQVMKDLGESLTTEQVEQMIKYADVDGDGRVNYEEWAIMYNQN